MPQSVSVVGRKQMETQNAQSVTEVLRYVPGVAIETYGPDPKGYDWIMMRGFNAQATSSYMDGLRQVSSSYSFFRTDPYQLDSAEVLRGPPPPSSARAMQAAWSTRPARSRRKKSSARSPSNMAAMTASRRSLI
ncbi:TonB-dependent receptor plug domain-containing protein [Pannonibacter sp. Pt2-lr]